jgi:hypothetical protein
VRVESCLSHQAAILGLAVARQSHQPHAVAKSRPKAPGKLIAIGPGKADIDHGSVRRMRQGHLKSRLTIRRKGNGLPEQLKPATHHLSRVVVILDEKNTEGRDGSRSKRLLWLIDNRGLRQWEADDKFGATSRAIADRLDCAVVELDEAAYERQADA